MTAVARHRAYQRTVPSQGTLACCSLALLAIAAGFSSNGPPRRCRPLRGCAPQVHTRPPFGVDDSRFRTPAPASPIMIARHTRGAGWGSPSVLAMSSTLKDAGGVDGSFDGDTKSGPVARLLRVPTRGIKEFWQGASYVHNNYLDLWWEISFQYLKWLSPFVAIFAAGIISNSLAILGETTRAWIPLLSEDVRSILERTLMFVQVPMRYVMMSLCFPYLLALLSTMSGVKRQPIREATGRLFKGTFMPWKDQAPHDFSPPTDNGFALYTSVGLLVPLVEELAIRFTFWKLWKRIEGTIRKRPKSAKNDESKGQNPSSLWMRASSLIFAGVHIGNHLPATAVAGTLTDRAENVVDLLVDYECRFAPVLRAMYQSILAFTLSTKVFCPQFLNGGIMASFGAHAAWNVLTVEYCIFNILFRLIMKLARFRMGRTRNERMPRESRASDALNNA